MIDIEKIKQEVAQLPNCSWSASTVLELITRLEVVTKEKDLLEDWLDGVRDDANQICELLHVPILSDAALAIHELQVRLESAEQHAGLRFDSFAGIVIWINNLRVCRKISETQITYEAVPGMVLTNETQRCLDEIAAMKEMK